jgi:hypothetical protein
LSPPVQTGGLFFWARLDGAGARRQKIEQPAFKKIKAFKVCPGVPS